MTLTKMTLESVEAMNPQNFHIGDIIEAQISFIAVPLKDNKYKMIAVLRSIVLLDASFTQARTVIVYTPVILAHEPVGSPEA